VGESESWAVLATRSHAWRASALHWVTACRYNWSHDDALWSSAVWAAPIRHKNFIEQLLTSATVNVDRIGFVLIVVGVVVRIEEDPLCAQAELGRHSDSSGNGRAWHQ
jgi:hypothetical protein